MAPHASFARLTLTYLVSGMASAPLKVHSAVPYNQPFPIVRPSANHSTMAVVPENLAQLATHIGSIALVSVVGPFHSGKSFLLNALLQQTQVFSVGSKTTPETMGIWLCRTNMKANDGSEVWLMDSEGFFGPGVDEGYDAKIFSVASLIGAHVVYNTVKVIDQQAVGLLEMLVQRAQLFRTRTQSSVMPEDTPDFLRFDVFPPLTWVVEDFVQDLPQQFKDEGATGWLRTYLKGSNVGDVAKDDAGDVAKVTDPKAKREKSDFLRKVFQDVRVHTLFLPATGREQLKDLSRLRFGELTPEFREEIAELRSHILSGLQARTSNGLPVTGRGLASTIQFLVRGLQQGMFHELPSLWEAWASQVVAVSMNDADAWFAHLLQRIDNKEGPVRVGIFNDRLDEAQENATTFYLALLRDFDKNPKVGDLRKRMEVRISGAIASYHERVRRWITELATKTKNELASFLNSFAVPVDPAVLAREGTTTSEALRAAFVFEFTAFAAVKSSGIFTRRTVSMPSFAPDPVTQLATDLRAQLGARNHENERAVQQMFKVAIGVVDDGIIRDLSEHSGTLINKARMQEIGKIVESRCWRMFDDQLSDYAWSKGVSHYKLNKALVKSEYLNARLSAFASSNEKRLIGHLSAALDRALSAYQANRTSIAMPATEEDIISRHSQMAAAARQLLQQSVRDLSDTEAFTNAMSRLDEQLAESIEFVQEKNIELWKVHSDEATRCGVARNREMDRACGLVCLWSFLPLYHKMTARRHLNDCFSQNAAGQQMTTPLRNRVFEAWYAKDLSRESSQVANRFAVFIFAIVLITLTVAWLLYGQNSFRYRLQPMGQYVQQHPQQIQQPGAYAFQDCNSVRLNSCPDTSRIRRRCVEY